MLIYSICVKEYLAILQEPAYIDAQSVKKRKGKTTSYNVISKLSQKKDGNSHYIGNNVHLSYNK